MAKPDGPEDHESYHPRTPGQPQPAERGWMLGQIAGNLADGYFAENIRSAREDRGLSQADLAHLMSEQGWPYYPQTVHRLETGRRKVSVGEAACLAKVLGKHLVMLLRSPRVYQAVDVVRTASSRARKSYEQITQWTAELLGAQEVLASIVAQFERDGFFESALVFGEVQKAIRELANDPDVAVADGRDLHQQNQKRREAEPRRVVSYVPLLVEDRQDLIAGIKDQDERD